jgi:hypothetical protein
MLVLFGPRVLGDAGADEVLVETIVARELRVEGCKQVAALAERDDRARIEWLIIVVELVFRSW